MHKILSVVYVFLWSFSFVNASIFAPADCIKLQGYESNSNLGNVGDEVVLIFEVSVNKKSCGFTIYDDPRATYKSFINYNDSFGISNLKILGVARWPDNDIVSIGGILDDSTGRCKQSGQCSAELKISDGSVINYTFQFQFQTCTATINSVSPLDDSGNIAVSEYGQDVTVDFTLGDACFKNRENVLYSFHTDILQSKASQLVSGQKSESVTTTYSQSHHTSSKNTKSTFKLQNLISGSDRHNRTLYLRLDQYNNRKIRIGTLKFTSGGEFSNFMQEQYNAKYPPTTITTTQEDTKSKCPNEDDCFISSGSLVPFIGEKYQDTNRRIFIFPEGGTTFSEFFNMLYRIIVAVSLLLAVIMIMYAGFKYMSTEAIAEKGEAKDRLVNIAFGLIVVLGVVLFLRVINPELLRLEPDLSSLAEMVERSDPGQYGDAGGVGYTPDGLAPKGVSGICSTGIVRVHNTNICSEIAKKYEQMIDSAENDGVVLVGGGYRSHEQQVYLRKKNCGTSNHAIYKQKSTLCNPPTAIPGRSLHESGLAVDFKDCENRTTACYKWLAKNAGKFGFYNFPKEPWHWSVNGQ